MRKVTVIVVAGVFLALAAAPAQAGGALLDFDQEFYVPGGTVRAQSGVWLKSSMGRLEDGPYFAYLSELTEDMPPPLPSDALRVASVEIVPRPTGEHGDASFEFTLPDVESGRYWVTVCNDPCRITLGDIMPTPLLVVADEDEGRIAVVRDRLSNRIRGLRIVVNNRVFGHRADSLRSRVTALERDMDHLLADLHEVRAAVERRPAPRKDETSSLPQLLAFVVPAAVLGMLVARRPRRSA
jgi:hypothetical protein